MPTIRKAYKKKYKTELHDDLEERSRHPTVRCLVELILKTPPSQAKGKDQVTRTLQAAIKGRYVNNVSKAAIWIMLHYPKAAI